MSDPNGLYHMRARYYNPEILRFTNQDILFGNIVDPQSLNRYAYVNGQPINYVDPFGLCREDSDQFLDDLQTIQDILGLVPGIGEPFDAINAIIYLLRGDYGYAALSIGACIPVLGIGATGGKIAGKTLLMGDKGAGKAYRYVSQGELSIIKKTGVIPNTDRAGNSKDVFVSTNKYKSVTDAEKGLQIGKQNPYGATESPIYRVEFDMNAAKYKYGGNVEGGTGIELITEQPIPVDLNKIYSLK